ncbi:MAG: hypothetical protein AAF449_08265 [Myxococcota bacterium]
MSRRVLLLFALTAACAVNESDEGRTQDVGIPGVVADAGVHDVGVPGVVTDAGVNDGGVASCDFTWCETAPIVSSTEDELTAFYQQRGARESFPNTYVDAIETLLHAEDEVVAGRFADARARLAALFERYPRSDPIWWSGVGRAGANVGTPVAYDGARLRAAIARIGPGTVETPTAIRFFGVLAPCSTGEIPTSPDLSTSEAVAGTLAPGITADDYRLLRESLRLFRHYVFAITDGALRVDLAVQEVENCVQVGFSPGNDPSYAISGIQQYTSPIAELSAAQRDQVDMYWVMYPSNVPEGPGFDEMSFITCGMGGYGARPVFISDELWLLRNPAHLGQGPMSTVERRVYLPQWLQHEFFHHLFRTWPAFELEARGHQWFDRDTWPADFVGEWEPDYYAEALAKRLRGASPSVAKALHVSTPPVDLSSLNAADFGGRFVRHPVENGYHEVTVAVQNGALVWRNAANVRWGLTWQDGGLSTGEDCPYGVQTLGVRTVEVAGALRVDALVFLGEAYVRMD